VCRVVVAGLEYQIAKMRSRIEHERTCSGQERLAIKTGEGGWWIAEFLAQALSLGGGWHEPNTTAALKRAAETEQLPPDDSASITGAYRKLLQIEFVLRRWNFGIGIGLPLDAERNIGWRSAAAFDCRGAPRCRRMSGERVFALLPQIFPRDRKCRTWAIQGENGKGGQKNLVSETASPRTSVINTLSDQLLTTWHARR